MNTGQEGKGVSTGKLRLFSVNIRNIILFINWSNSAEMGPGGCKALSKHATNKSPYPTARIGHLCFFINPATTHDNEVGIITWLLIMFQSCMLCCFPVRLMRMSLGIKYIDISSIYTLNLNITESNQFKVSSRRQHNFKKVTYASLLLIDEIKIKVQ